MASDLTAERVARNDAIFREANEGIRDSAERHGMNEQVPFLCECPQPTCTEIVQLSMDQYEAIRANPIRFVNAVGHQRAAPEHKRVVSEQEGHVVIEKRGRAADIAAELDPRSGDAEATGS
jgi:hypothetical protein